MRPAQNHALNHVQMLDAQTKRTAGERLHSPNTTSSIQEGGLITKKDLFFILRPGVVQYRSRTVRQFFTDERLRRCGISPDQFKRIRVFPAEATAVIRDDLRQMKFI